MWEPMATTSSESSVTLSMGKVSYAGIRRASAIFRGGPSGRGRLTPVSRARHLFVTWGLYPPHGSVVPKTNTHGIMPMLPTKSKWTALLGCALAFTTLAPAQTDSNKALLMLLVKKGIITQDDANEIEREVTAAPASAPSAPAAVAGKAAGATMQPATASSSGVPGYSGAAAGGVPVVSGGSSPLSFKIGVADFTPFGFIDFTGVYRNEATGSAIGSSFNGIPYSNGSTGQLSETKF